jgi:uncharacterized protein with PIN domain
MSFNQLLEIIKDNRKIAEDEKAKTDFANCPECSFPLTENSKGEKLCRICGWRSR